MKLLDGKNIVLGVTGGIAAYKACDLTSRLRKAGAQVFVIMTKNACEFVRPLTFETLSNHPAVTDTFARPETWEVEHIALAKRADLFLIAPATANLLAKAAHGIADDMLTSTLLASSAPKLLAPAMNTGMWDNPATRENVEILRRRGFHLIGPETGNLACGDSGKGRMSEPEQIVAACAEILRASETMKGLRVIVTAGPTREKLDPVRYLTNRSSGKMGYAIAEEARLRGAKVTLVTGPVALSCHPDIERVRVESTGDLLNALTERCGECDLLIQSAAPCDFTVLHPASQKIKKDGSGELKLTLTETPDAAAACGAMKKPGQVFIGFAAETESHVAHAQEKLKKKNLDLIALNDVSRSDIGFDSDDNQLTLVLPDEIRELSKASKAQSAAMLLDAAEELLRRAGKACTRT